MNLTFSKYSGLGNDFILIDNRDRRIALPNPEAVKRACQRRLGIGADGVIFLESSDKADVKMRIFNADGSEAEMCGNGIRCLMKFMQELGMPKKPYNIEVHNRILSGRFEDGLIGIDMGVPTEIRWNMNVEGNSLDFLDTGVPHAVVFVQDLLHYDVENAGRALRGHKAFAPKGTNATFAEIHSPGRLLFRTYERGVEAETLACGTGAAAAAFAYRHREECPNTLTVENKLGEKMAFRIDNDSHIHMIGPANHVYTGRFLFENN